MEDSCTIIKGNWLDWYKAEEGHWPLTPSEYDVKLMLETVSLNLQSQSSRCCRSTETLPHRSRILSVGSGATSRADTWVLIKKGLDAPVSV